MTKLRIPVLVAIFLIALSPLKAQEFDLFLVNGFEDPVYLRVLYYDSEGTITDSGSTLVEPGEEEFFCTTTYGTYYLTCYNAERTEYLVDTDTQYEHDNGVVQHYIKRELSREFIDQVVDAGSYRWREVVPGSFSGNLFMGKRDAYILNDTDQPARMIIKDTWRWNDVAEKWFTLQPGEKKYLDTDFASETYLQVYGTSGSGGGMVFYAGGSGFIRMPGTYEARYYTTLLREDFGDNYSDAVYRLSSADDRRNWLTSCEITVGYNEKVAVSYYSDGRWVDQVLRNDTTIYMDSTEFYYIFNNLDRDVHWGAARSIDYDDMNDLMAGRIGARRFAKEVYIPAGKEVVLYLGDDNQLYESSEIEYR